MNNEPTLHEIDDFNNKESPQKRRTIRNVIIGLILMSAVYGATKYYFSTVSDRIDTSSNPAVYK